MQLLPDRPANLRRRDEMTGPAAEPHRVVLCSAPHKQTTLPRLTSVAATERCCARSVGFQSGVLAGQHERTEKSNEPSRENANADD